jgi:hypothetical protein
MGVPEFAMRDHEFILGLPEFTMVRNRIVLSLPQITIRNVDVVVADMRRDAQAAKEETETGIRSDLKEVGTASQTRIVASVSKIFEGARTKLIEQREQAFIVFDGLICGHATRRRTRSPPSRGVSRRRLRIAKGQLTASRSNWLASTLRSRTSFT